MLNQKCKVMYKKSLANLRHKKILLIFATSQFDCADTIRKRLANPHL